MGRRSFGQPFASGISAARVVEDWSGGQQSMWSVEMFGQGSLIHVVSSTETQGSFPSRILTDSSIEKSWRGEMMVENEASGGRDKDDVKQIAFKKVGLQCSPSYQSSQNCGDPHAVHPVLTVLTFLT